MVKDEKVKKNFKFLLSFDNRNSSVLNESVKFNGLKIGVEYKEVHDFGLGIYSTRIPVKKEAKQKGVDVEATLNYTTLFYQYAFLHNDKWELAVPFHIGNGRANLLFFDAKSDSVIINKDGIERADVIEYSVAEIGFDAQYKIFRWFGLGSGVGYRFTFSGNENVKNLLNAPFFSFKIKIFIGELYHTIKDKVKKDEPDN